MLLEKEQQQPEGQWSCSVFEELSCFVPRPLHLVDSKKERAKCAAASDVLNLLLLGTGLSKK